MSYARDRRKKGMKEEEKKLREHSKKMAMEGMRTSTPHACRCGSPFYINAFKLMRVSPLYTVDKRTKFIPIATMVCVNCMKEPQDEQKTIPKDSKPVEGAENLDQGYSETPDQALEE